MANALAEALRRFARLKVWRQVSQGHYSVNGNRGWRLNSASFRSTSVQHLESTSMRFVHHRGDQLDNGIASFLQVFITGDEDEPPVPIE
jgi:hypothetical protein